VFALAFSSSDGEFKDTQREPTFAPALLSVDLRIMQYSSIVTLNISDVAETQGGVSRAPGGTLLFFYTSYDVQRQRFDRQFIVS
jgi:hypothetical protein